MSRDPGKLRGRGSCPGCCPITTPWRGAAVPQHPAVVWICPHRAVSAGSQPPRPLHGAGLPRGAQPAQGASRDPLLQLPKQLVSAQPLGASLAATASISKGRRKGAGGCARVGRGAAVWPEHQCYSQTYAGCGVWGSCAWSSCSWGSCVWSPCVAGVGQAPWAGNTQPVSSPLRSTAHPA